MLDISIKNINKITDAEFEKFKLSEWIIEEKYDGTKLTLLRNNQPFDEYDYKKNWIVSYKGNIIYPFEADICQKDDIDLSIGISQYSLVHKHLQNIHPKTKVIPKNTEFFVEFMMNKPTLTREYRQKHFMILVGYSSTQYNVRGGMLETYPDGFNTFLRRHFASMLNIKTPEKLGMIFPIDVVSHSISKSKFIEGLLSLVSTKESYYGGLVEGFVLVNEQGERWKCIQPDQHDKETRLKIKMKYRYEDKNKETEYWKDVNVACDKLQEQVKSLSFLEALNESSDQIYGGLWDRYLPKHEKRNFMIKRDDMFLTMKIKMTNNLLGNNWATFIGKFRIFTKAHYKIIETALKKYDGVVIGIVSSKNQVIPKRFREDVIKKCFPKNIEIIHLQTGNLVTVFKKAKNTIKAVLCGSDRVADYQSQLKGSFNVELEEIPREDEDISASKVCVAISQSQFIPYMENVPKEIGNRTYFNDYKLFFNQPIPSKL